MRVGQDIKIVMNVETSRLKLLKKFVIAPSEIVKKSNGQKLINNIRYRGIQS